MTLKAPRSKSTRQRVRRRQLPPLFQTVFVKADGKVDDNETPARVGGPKYRAVAIPLRVLLGFYVLIERNGVPADFLCEFCRDRERADHMAKAFNEMNEGGLVRAVVKAYDDDAVEVGGT